LYFLIV